MVYSATSVALQVHISSRFARVVPVSLVLRVYVEQEAAVLTQVSFLFTPQRALVCKSMWQCRPPGTQSNTGAGALALEGCWVLLEPQAKLSALQARRSDHLEGH